MAEAARNTILRRLIKARRADERKKREFEAARRVRNELERQANAVLRESGDKSVTVDLGKGYGTFRFAPRNTRFGQVLDKDTALAALEAEGEHVAVKDIGKQRINQLVNERLDHKQDLPAGVGWYEEKKVTVTEIKD